MKATERAELEALIREHIPAFAAILAERITARREVVYGARRWAGQSARPILEALSADAAPTVRDLARGELFALEQDEGNLPQKLQPRLMRAKGIPKRGRVVSMTGKAVQGHTPDS